MTKKTIRELLTAALICRLIGHACHEQPLRAAGRSCSAQRRRRCRTVPQRAGTATTRHRPASERTLRAYLTGFPDWLIDECLRWTRDREAHGWRFTTGEAAARHWLDHAEQVTRIHDLREKS